jgi:lambda family phage portal protein
MANILDRFIAAVSPQRGLERARARAGIQRITAYTAGQAAPRNRPWVSSSKGPNAEVGAALRNLRKRSREAVRDNPYAARAVSIRVAQEIGFGIKPRSNTGDTALDDQVDALWAQFVAQSDVYGVLDFYGQQALAARTRSQDGEALIRLIRLSPRETRERGLALPLQLEVLEPDFLEDAVQTMPGQARVVMGIEMDSRGRPAFYRLLRRHPGEGMPITGGGALVDRVPASEIIHLYRAHQQRPGQVRGVPDAAPVLMRMQRLEEYTEAALEQAKVQALLGVFITTPDPLEMGGSGSGGDSAEPLGGRGYPTELYPGMVGNLPVGSEPKFLQPSGAGSFEPFALHEMMAIAVGFGVTYDQLTGDLRQANFSSLRAGKIEFRRSVEQDQWLMHIPRMCEPVYRAFIDAAVLSGRLTDRPAGYPVIWDTPRFEMVDPTKEIPAAVNAIRSGLETWPQAVSSMGYDPRRQADEIKATNRLLDERGIILDCDPRRSTTSGQAQNPAQNAAVELGAPGAMRPARTAQITETEE